MFLIGAGLEIMRMDVFLEAVMAERFGDGSSVELRMTTVVEEGENNSNKMRVQGL